MSKKLRVVGIIQARMGATRLPGKPLLKVGDKPLLFYQLERLQGCQLLDEIAVATTTHPRDQVIVQLCQSLQIPFFCGSEEDVLDRYYQAAKKFNADGVVRITADCPLIDPHVVDQIVEFYLNNSPQYDYVSNTLERTFPRGLDVEVFSMKSLTEAALEAKKRGEREHVTPFIYGHPECYALGNVVLETNESHHRWTVDTSEDFELIKLILKALYPKKKNFNLQDILLLLKENPSWIELNAHIQQKKV